jgi:phosphoenolpyruvate carboxylase
MPDVSAAPPTSSLAQELLDLTARLGARADEDPFGNPVLLVSLAITRQLDTGSLSEANIEALIRYLRDAAFNDRAGRISTYLGGIDTTVNDGILASLAQHLLRPDPNDSPIRWAEYQALTERTRFAAVFTAHPTFSLPLPVNQPWPRPRVGARSHHSIPIGRHRSPSAANSTSPPPPSPTAAMRSIVSTPP